MIVLYALLETTQSMSYLNDEKLWHNEICVLLANFGNQLLITEQTKNTAPYKIILLRMVSQAINAE